MSLRLSVFLAASLACLAALFTPAFSDHPFDAGRYAHEIFSEDETLLSRYAAEMPEKEVEAMLTKAWAELDRTAEKTQGMESEAAKAAIRQAVRGDGGVADRFRSDVAQKAAEHSAVGLARWKREARRPLVFLLVAVFVVVLVWINRRRG